jgi:hypothetical protein
VQSSSSQGVLVVRLKNITTALSKSFSPNAGGGAVRFSLGISRVHMLHPLSLLFSVHFSFTSADTICFFVVFRAFNVFTPIVKRRLKDLILFKHI